jgi:phage minor structural protein
MLFIFDKYDNLLTILDSSSKGACPYYEPFHEEELNGPQKLEFVVPATHPDAQYVVEENQVAFKDEDGYFRLFVIREIEETDGAETAEKHVYCEPAMLELENEPIEDIRPQNTTAQYALTRALEKTRWRVGEVAELGTNSTNFYYESVLSAIQKIIETWGGELRDRIEVQGNRIVGRYIDLLARRGQDTGKRFEIGKDLESIRRKVVAYPVTALYGRGNGQETDEGGYTRKLTFADVEWKKSDGKPVDKPKGQEWVGDPDALQKYGIPNSDGTLRHRFDFVDFDEDDPEKLLERTWEELQKRKEPLVEYQLDVIVLEHFTGYEHEKVRLGDSIVAIDKNFANPIVIEARATKIRRNLLNKAEKTITFGNFIDKFSTQKRLEQLETKINDRSGIWDQVEQPVDDTDFPDIVPPTPSYLNASGGFKTVMLEWNYDPSSYIAAYEVYGSQVQGFTPDSSNLLFRGKTSTWVHQVDTNQTWYYRVRAINTHGTAGGFSQEASAQTARIISDDILFGAINAQHLADLAVTAAKLADGAVDNTKLDRISPNRIQIDSVDIKDAAITSAKIASAAVGTVAIQNGAVTNAKIAQAAVGTAQIQDLAVTNAKIADLAVDNAKIADLHGSKITAGSITGDKIAARSITTDKLVVSDLTNYCVNPVFEGGSNQEWSNVTAVLSTTAEVPSGAPTTYVGRQSSRDSYCGGFFPVNEGEKFYVEVWCVTPNSTQKFGVGLKFEKEDGTGTWLRAFQTTPIGTWTKFSGEVTVPSGYTKARVWTQIEAFSNFGDWYFTKVVVRRKVAGELIVDGTITANKLNVTSLSAISANLGNVTAGNITGVYIKGSTIEGTVLKSSDKPSFDDPNYTTKASIQSGWLQFWDKSLGAELQLKVSGLGLNLEGSPGIWDSAPSAYKPASGDMTRIMNGVISSTGSFYINATKLGMGSPYSILFEVRQSGVDTILALGDTRIIDVFLDRTLDIKDNNYNYKTIRAFSTAVNAVDINTGTHLYIRPSSGGEVRVTVTGSTSVYAPMRAKEYNPPSSLRETKKNIEEFTDDTLEVFKKLRVYAFNYKFEEDDKKKTLGLMLDEAPEIIRNASGDSIDMYSSIGYLYLGLKQAVTKLDELEKRLSVVENKMA